MRIIALLCCAAALSGCAIQRAQVAQDARAQMVGLSQEQVLGCMGPPGNKAVEGQTEVWSYASGNGYSSTIASADVSRLRKRCASAIKCTVLQTPQVSERRFQRDASAPLMSL